MLKVDRVQSSTANLGPGKRAVVWFHGCTRGCEHCIASEMNRSDEYEPFDAKGLAERICSIPGIEGVSLSGGEPFQQDSKELLLFLKELKTRSNLGIMVYTGYLLSELKGEERFSELLNQIDLLVDGPYVYELDGGELWRGSSNQSFHFLTNRYKSLARDLERSKGRQIDVTFEKGLEFAFAGIPPKDFKQKLSHRLRGSGMDIKW